MADRTRPGNEARSVGIDFNTPSVARMYDHYLGGKDNYPVDREACAQLDVAAPGTRTLAVNNRRYLQRAVRYLAQERGIRQFLDHGSGLPTQDNVHQMAQRVDPTARTVYVDNDPIVLAHGRALLADNDNTAFIHADVRDAEAVLEHPDTVRLIDFDQPVAALYVSFLHCVPDADDPVGLVRRLLDRLAPGSFLVVSHLVSEDEATRKKLTDFMVTSTGGNWGRVRQPQDVSPLFEGLELVEPGLVEISTWRPDSEISGPKQETFEWIEYGGVARKP